MSSVAGWLAAGGPTPGSVAQAAWWPAYGSYASMVRSQRSASSIGIFLRAAYSFTCSWVICRQEVGGSDVACERRRVAGRLLGWYKDAGTRMQRAAAATRASAGLQRASAQQHLAHLANGEVGGEGRGKVEARHGRGGEHGAAVCQLHANL